MEGRWGEREIVGGGKMEGERDSGWRENGGRER